MTRNAENIQRIHPAPFMGWNAAADEEDVPDGYFVDGENLVCGKAPGMVVSRPGYNHWSVDANGFGILYPDPVAILPGSGMVDGVLTPPGLVAATPGPASIPIPLDDEPPLIPEDGPIVPVDTPEEVEAPTDPIPEPPVTGAISLAANPSSGNVDTGEDLTVNFTITENLPEGVTIANYAWDYRMLIGEIFASDGTASGTTNTHAYDIDDFGEYENNFVVAVRGTGSDSVVYQASTPMKIIDLTEVAAENMIKIIAPDVATLPNATAFSITVQNLEKNTAGQWTPTATSLDSYAVQIDGATLADSAGGTLSLEESTFSFDSSTTASQSFQVLLADDQNTGTVSIGAVQETTGKTAMRTWNVVKSRILVEIVDENGDAITYIDYDTFIPDEQLIWTFYLKLTAQDATGETVIDFNQDVKVKFKFDFPSGPYVTWDDESLTASIIGVDKNAIYNPETAQAVNAYGEYTIPRTEFYDGNYGQASLKVAVAFNVLPYDYDSQSQDLNSGVSDMTVTAEVI